MSQAEILERPDSERLRPESSPSAPQKSGRPSFNPADWRPKGECADVQDVADFFLSDRPDGVPLSNLRLQRLCAYAQAFSLGLRGRRLFGESLEDFGRGSVVRKLWERYGGLSSKGPLKPADVGLPKPILRFAPDERLVLYFVNAHYGVFPLERLRRNMLRDFPKDLSDAVLKEAFKEHPAVNFLREIG
ncbi:MAG: hypothetical protein LBR22_01805 [Desulfovibrio sp.]|nr:hypothetical protein [Desulfovibrio sp.]